MTKLRKLKLNKKSNKRIGIGSWRYGLARKAQLEKIKQTKFEKPISWDHMAEQVAKKKWNVNIFSQLCNEIYGYSPYSNIGMYKKFGVSYSEAKQMQIEKLMQNNMQLGKLEAEGMAIKQLGFLEYLPPDR